MHGLKVWGPQFRGLGIRGLGLLFERFGIGIWVRGPRNHINAFKSTLSGNKYFLSQNKI